MIDIKFFDSVDDALLKFAVVIARHRGKWVFCKHRERDTYECPGGHREPGEAIDDTARRELWEETGASVYSLHRLGVYAVIQDSVTTFGMMYFCEIDAFGELPPLEIERVELFETLPVNWTYPLIQPVLIDRVKFLGLVP